MREKRILSFQQDISQRRKRYDEHTKPLHGASVSLNGNETHENLGTEMEPYDPECPSSEMDSESAETDGTIDSEVIL